MIFSVWMQAVRETHSTLLFLIIITIYKLTQFEASFASWSWYVTYVYHVHTSRYIYYVIQPIALSYNIVILCGNLESWTIFILFLLLFLSPTQPLLLGHMLPWDYSFHWLCWHYHTYCELLDTSSTLFCVCNSLHNVYGFILVLNV